MPNPLLLNIQVLRVKFYRVKNGKKSGNSGKPATM